MKTTFTAIALIFSTATFAQGIKEVQLVITPTYSTRYLDADEEFSDFVNDVEEGMISYDVGVLIYPFSGKRIAIGTGLIYSRKGYFWAKRTYRDMYGEPLAFKTKESVNYLEIPVRITYHLSANAKTYLLLGVCNDIFVNSKIKTYSGGYNMPESAIRKYNLGINIGLGHNFRISESITVGVEPNIKFQTLPYVDEDTLWKRYLYTIGLSIITKIKV